MSDLVNETLIKLNVDTSTRKETIKYLAQLIAEDSNRLGSFDEYYQTLLEREEKSSTALGNQIAIPHGKEEYVKESKIAIAILDNSVKWGAETIEVVFLLALKNKQSKLFFKNFHKIIDDREIIKRLKNADTEEEIKDIII